MGMALKFCYKLCTDIVKFQCKNVKVNRTKLKSRQLFTAHATTNFYHNLVQRLHNYLEQPKSVFN